MKHVVVIGGGISGLTAATLLNEAGLQVTLLEASPSLGGLAKSDRSKDNFPTEHSLRVYHQTYQCYFTLLKKIPFNANESVFDQIVPVDVGMVYKQDICLFQGKKHKSLLTKVSDRVRLANFLTRQGFRIKDFLQMLKEEMIVRMSQQHLMHRFSAIPIGQFLKKASPAFMDIVHANHKLTLVANKRTAAVLAVEVDMNCKPFTNYFMANGPTSERVFQPWEAYLQTKDVIIKKNSRVVDIHLEDNRLRSVQLETGEHITGDIFVCAISNTSFVQLVNNTALANKLAPIDKININSEWSNGAQFYLSDLPSASQDSEYFFKPGLVKAHLSAPWKLDTIIQGDNFWQNVELPQGCRYVLSVTYTDVNANGIIYTKPFWECTREEIKQELLKQCGFNQPELIIDWHLDDAIVFKTNLQYQQEKAQLPPHAAHQCQDGSWMLNFLPISVATPESLQSALPARTAIDNLYLAGDYCRTAMFITTMEKACESGYLTAQAISEDLDLPIKIYLPFKSYDTKNHAFWRSSDAVLFKAHGWIRKQIENFMEKDQKY